MVAVLLVRLPWEHIVENRRTDVKSNRFVCVKSVLFKILEWIMNTRGENWLLKHIQHARTTQN